MTTRLTEAERSQLATDLPGWSMSGERDAIRREFKFADFSAAWAFMTRVALLAEKHDHHPEWSNIWNSVRIALSTHDVGGVSGKDVQLAKAIDALLT